MAPILTRKKRHYLLVLAAAWGCFSWLTPANASATTNEQSPTTTSQLTVTGQPIKTPATPYYAVNGGTLYGLTPQGDRVGLTATQDLKTVPATTWTATAQLAGATPTGQPVRYLYVQAARTGLTGWVDVTRLVPGRNAQVSAVRQVPAKNYVAVKAFKAASVPTQRVYQLTGPAAAMRWTHGQKLSRAKTYRVTQRRTYYQAGQAYTYLHVTSGKTTGWVWQSDLKRGTAYNVAHHQAAIKVKLQKYLNLVTKDRTAAVAFYNLTPVKDSRAAKAPHAAVYRQGKLAVNARGSHVTTSASTYKLYIAAYLLHLKQQYRFSWTPANRAGMTRMIVKSANDYPVSVLQRHGRTSINHWLASQGYYGSPFSAVRASRTTANSLVKVLKDLQLGQKAFTNRQDRAFILSLMKRQVYRRGIPTGVARANRGTIVQDKVGFLNDNNGDAGIVTLPNGQ